MLKLQNRIFFVPAIGYRFLAVALNMTLFAGVSVAAEASKSCTGGAAIADFKLVVEPAKGGPALPVTSVNVIQPGEKLRYEPIARHGDKKVKDNRDKIAIVLVPASESALAHVQVLKAQPAKSPATWEVPFRVSVVGLVFGSDGLDVKKLNALVEKNPQLIPQLTNYAASASKVEALVQTLSKYEQSAPGSSNLQTALGGFSKQYGVTLPQISTGTAPDQQASQLLQAILPAFNSNDPLSAHASLAAQSTGVAASVASMFFGPSMTLAAGGAAFVNEVRASLFPNTNFRSAFAQPVAPEATRLCSAVQKAVPHTRTAYLWMVHIPDTAAPALALQGAPRLPLDWTSTIAVSAATVAQLPMAERARDWELVSVSSSKTQSVIPVKVDVGSVADRLTLDLSGAKLPPGEYHLAAKWDWTPMTVAGVVDLHKVPDLSGVRLTPDSQDELVAANGKVRLGLTGADFEFVKNVTLGGNLGSGSNAAPAKLSFTLGKAAGSGERNTMFVNLDTASLKPGPYSLDLAQVNGSSHNLAITIQPPNPKLAGLPLRINLDDPRQAIELRGTGLERIRRVISASAVWQLAPVPMGSSDLTSRDASVTLESNASQGDLLSATVFVDGIRKPLIVPDALRVAAPLPKILGIQNSFAPDTSVAFREGEIPADSAASFEMQVANIGGQPVLQLACRRAANTKQKLFLTPGEKESGAELESVGDDALFLSVTPGDVGRPTCLLTATLSAGDTGTSAPFALGRIVLLPRIDKFTISSVKIGDGLYEGTLTGQDLQLVDKTGWDAAAGNEVESIPTPVAGNPGEQTLNIVMSWPPPAPQAPLYIWLRGEDAGRATTAKY